MLGNVTCHVRECTSGVIGQCSGYKQTCGRFFCTDHSTDYGNRGVLCSVCAEKLERDALAEYRFRDYLKTAEEIGPMPPTPRGCSQLELIGLAGAALVVASIDIGSGIFLFIVFALIIWAIESRKGHIGPEAEALKAKAASFEAEKPGFTKFYEQWCEMKEQQQAEESAEAWRNALIGVIAVAAVAGAVHEQIKNDQMRRDIHDIARSIRRR